MSFKSTSIKEVELWFADDFISTDFIIIIVKNHLLMKYSALKQRNSKYI